MDSARIALTKATRNVQACTFRVNAAQQAFTTALSNVKNHGDEGECLADQAGKDLQSAKAALEAAQADEETAKQALNTALASRSRRQNRHDKFEIAVPADAAPVVAPYVETAQAAFADLSSLKSFPEPETKACTNAHCTRSATSRAMTACQHNLQAAFAGMNAKELKAAKKTFDPAQFEENKDFAAKAAEVCDVISNLIGKQSKNEMPNDKGGKVFDTKCKWDRGMGKKHGKK